MNGLIKELMQGARLLVVPDGCDREYCRGHRRDTINFGLSREVFLNYPILVRPTAIQTAFDGTQSNIEAKVDNNQIQSAP